VREEEERNEGEDEEDEVITNDTFYRPSAN